MKNSLSKRSARHGRPKAGRGAERAKRAERAQSAFTENRLKKYVPHKGLTEKKICPSLIFLIPQTRTTQKKKYVPKILLIFPLPNIGASQKKKYVPKTQVTQVGKSFFVLKKFLISGVFL